MNDASATLTPSLRQLCGYFLKLSATGFGGPIALAGAMERDLVTRLNWLERRDYLDALALAQLAPGPLAAQMAMYIGWLRAGFFGALVTGVSFVAPAFTIILILTFFYQKFGAFPWMAGMLYGIGAGVIAVIARSAWRLTKLTAERNVLLWFMAIFTGAATFYFQAEPLSIFLGCGVVNCWVSRRPKTPAPSNPAPLSKPLGVFLLGLLGATLTTPLWAATMVVSGATLITMFLYFFKAGALVFGSGLAILPYLHHGVVEQFHWLTDRQFIDAVSLGMITPGPAVITVAFIGAMTAGIPGALVASLGTFLPCFLFVVIPAPYFQKIKNHSGVNAFILGVTAAAVGTIGAAAITLGSRAISDIVTLTIALLCLVLLLWVKRLPEPLVILAAGIAGWCLL